MRSWRDHPFAGFLERMVILSFFTSAMKQRSARGQPIGTADPMIAAIAIEHGLQLVTGNTAHFQRIQRLGYPLTLANWRT